MPEEFLTFPAEFHIAKHEGNVVSALARFTEIG
jgi:hypothetical protein